jgi:hypothetical protein
MELGSKRLAGAFSDKNPLVESSLKKRFCFAGASYTGVFRDIVFVF